MLRKLYAKIDDGDWEYLGTYETDFAIDIAKLNFDYCNARYPVPKIIYREEPIDNT